MKTDLCQLDFDGVLLARGFWLYVWEITTGNGSKLHYVGKTGDKASGVSQSPFDRLSKHLGSNKNNNALLRHLEKLEIDPKACRFSFHAWGPLADNDTTKTHGELCDICSGLEKALADAMAEAGYTLINSVRCRVPLDKTRFASVRAAFAAQFPRLADSTKNS